MYRFRSILVLLLIIGLSSCDLLEKQEPQQSLSPDGGLSSVTQLQNAVVGAYDGLQTNTGGESFGETIFSQDLIADNVVFTGSFPTFNEISNQKMVTNNGSIEAMWEGAYSNINDVNIILKKLDELENPKAGQATLDNIKGQALFIRAVQYYYLVNLFALPSGSSQGESQMGVPLQTEAVTSAADFKKPSRSSVAEVYKQITTDLKDAAKLLSPSNARNKARPAAANGLLARIAMVRHNYGDAATISGNIISNAGTNYQLNPDVKTYFTDELSKESMFEIQNTTQDVPDGANTSITAVFNIDARDDIQISKSFATAINSTLNSRQESAISSAGATVKDTRKTELIVGKDGNGDIITQPSRSAYTGAESNSDKYESGQNNDDNIPIIRYAEVKLIRAEAKAREDGKNQISVDLLNDIRERAFNVDGANDDLVDYKLGDFANKQELIDAVLLERRVELAFEGQRFTTLKRLKKNVRGKSYDSNDLTYPIPQTQVDANDNIKQNPAYQ